MSSLFTLPQKLFGWLLLVPAMTLAILSVFFGTLGGVLAYASAAIVKLAEGIHG